MNMLRPGVMLDKPQVCDACTDTKEAQASHLFFDREGRFISLCWKHNKEHKKELMSYCSNKSDEPDWKYRQIS